MRVMQTLPIPLSDAELAGFGEELVEVLEKRDALEAEKKEVDDGYKRQIAATEADETTLRATINNREKMADVECLETEIPGTNEVVVVRLDTGVEISRRTLSSTELQTNMFAETEEDELRVRVLATLKLRDSLKIAGVLATSDVLWAIEPAQAVEATAYAAAKEADPTAELPVPEWLQKLIDEHPQVTTVPEAGDYTAADGEQATEEADASSPTAEAPAEPGSGSPEAAPPPEQASTAAPAKPKRARRKKAAAGAPGAPPPAATAAPAEPAQADSTGRMDEVDVQEELDSAGIQVGLDVITAWTQPQMMAAVNYSRVLVKRKTDASIEEPKKPEFLP